MKYRSRSWIVALCIYLGFFTIIVRLFYWQIIKGDSLEAIAQSQYQKTIAFSGKRGTITTSDGYTLVGNETVYRLFANPNDISDPNLAVTAISPLLAEYYANQANEIESRLASTLDEAKNDTILASPSGESINNDTILDPEQLENNSQEISAQQALFTSQAIAATLSARLTTAKSNWVALAPKISQELKDAIENLSIHGIGFDPYLVRSYPESSMAAQLVGFVGKDSYGEDIGYFGIEGALNNELKKRHFQTNIDTGAFGFQLFKAKSKPSGINGRDVTLSIRRDVQHTIELELQNALERYGAQSGEIIVLEPSTGKILGLASYPNYDPGYFYEFDQTLYKNPAVSDLFEPGSTFKPLTVAAGLDAEVITPDTNCPRCATPVEIGKYEIKTWNNQYTPDITMTDALSKSDNTAMVYIAQELGADKFKAYLQKFGIGEHTTDEMQEDRNTPFPTKWGQIELATRSFGQGISVTSLQLLRAIATIANNGVMMQPSLLESLYDPITNTTIIVEPKEVRKVISPEAAQKATQMMVAAAEYGEAKWTTSKTHTIAAKTGTAQIAVQGGYADDRTIASYVGFAPAHNPKYVMLVKLVEPTTSPWASETAAPLWHRVANKLHLLLEIPPDKV